jgi:drug/metabolite transporter (DMT)-like permease
MKPLMLIGIVLIVIGVIALAYGGFSFTTSEKVAEVGPLKIEKDKTRSVPLPPVLGGLALVGGLVLVVVGARKG